MAIDVNSISQIETSPLSVVGRLVDASNATLLCETESGIKVIYKPVAGERPLWDFPDGNLASREFASYLISEWGRFHLIPFTILREGPFGIGAVQLWIDVDESIDITEFGESKNAQLRQMALLDAVLNNTDRKFGHLLIDSDGRLYGCDHGVTLHQDPKLRTILWQWSGEEMTISERRQLESLIAHIDDKKLLELVTSEELFALRNRIADLLRSKRFPEPSENWPPVPWPPY